MKTFGKLTWPVRITTVMFVVLLTFGSSAWERFTVSCGLFLWGCGIGAITEQRKEQK